MDERMHVSDAITIMRPKLDQILKDYLEGIDVGAVVEQMGPAVFKVQERDGEICRFVGEIVDQDPETGKIRFKADSHGGLNSVNGQLLGVERRLAYVKFSNDQIAQVAVDTLGQGAFEVGLVPASVSTTTRIEHPVTGLVSVAQEKQTRPQHLCDKKIYRFADSTEHSAKHSLSTQQ